jgi:diguanylate cyclase (GGDEF)-like protein
LYEDRIKFSFLIKSGTCSADINSQKYLNSIVAHVIPITAYILVGAHTVNSEEGGTDMTGKPAENTMITRGITMMQGGDDPATAGHYDIFCNIGTILTSSLDPDEVFRRVMSVIGEYFAPQYWSLLLLDDETGCLKFEIVMGVNAEPLNDFCLEPGEGIAGWVCRHGRPLVIEDVRYDTRFSSRTDELLGFDTRSVVCVPLLNGRNRIIGVIELINKVASTPDTSDVEERFTNIDMAILSSIGVFTGIAAENAFLHQKVVELAMIDSLTGLNNRLCFSEAFEREVERMVRYNQKLCVLMADIDNFKMINDTHGHLMGDKILCAIADILRSSVRKSDIVARYGGDEFVILMPMADEAKGHIVATRIRDLLAEWNETSPLPDTTLGLSIGIHEADRENVKDILIKADEKLYQEKEHRKKPEDIVSDTQIRRYLRDTLAGER